VSNDAFGHATKVRQRASHQPLRGTHPEAAGDELVPDEALAGVQLSPGPLHGLALNQVIFVPKGKQPLLDPVGQ
jgi:hypothetical protein